MALEHELIAILQYSRDNFVLIDKAGMALWASPNSYAIYGTDPGYFIGKSANQLKREQILGPSATALTLKRGAKTQIMQTTRTGCLVLATAVPVFDQS